MKETCFNCKHIKSDDWRNSIFYCDLDKLTLTYEQVNYFLEENKETANELVKKMIKASQARNAARKAREEARKGKGQKVEKSCYNKRAGG